MRDKNDHPYCHKSKRESLWCKYRKIREEPKVNQGAPITSSQVYGWREPIDNLATGFNRSAVCKRTFFDPGHLW